MVVGGLEVVSHREALAAREHAALAERRELGRLDRGLRLRARVDVRHHDALGAAIERAVDRRVVVVHHPHHAGHAPEVAGPGQVAAIGVVDAPVLALEPDAVGAERAGWSIRAGSLVPARMAATWPAARRVFTRLARMFIGASSLPSAWRHRVAAHPAEDYHLR